MSNTNYEAQQQLAEMLEKANPAAKATAEAMATGYLAGFRDGLAKQNA